MRFIRLLIISFIVLFLIVTGISLLIPSHVRLSKAIDIKASRDAILTQLNDPAQWRHWYPRLDSAQLFYEAGQVNGVSLNDRAGTLIVLTRQSPQEVVTEFKGHKMKQLVSGWNIIPAADSTIVTVQWYMDFSLRWYPWEKFSSLVLEKTYGPVMEQGLARLKKLVEN